MEITKPANGERVQFDKELAGLVQHIQQAENASSVEAPFSQREHSLMMDSIDHFARDWTAELKQARLLNEKLERMVQQRAATVKNELTKLFLLGAASASEARRSAELNAKLAEELYKLDERP